jgi:hypothetical protein
MSTLRDAWRSAARYHLRVESCRFTLTAMGLDLWSDWPEAADGSWDGARIHVLTRLTDFVSRHPAWWWSMRWGRLWAREVPERKPPALTEARFAADGTLLELPAAPGADLIEAYNATRHAPDTERVARLQSRLGTRVLWWRPWLTGLQITFEELPASRLTLPDFSAVRHVGGGLINCVCRIHPDYRTVDLWLQFNHVAVDGLPMQEILDELKQEWGVRRPLAPEGDDFACAGTDHVVTAFDFGPLKAARKRLQARYPDLSVSLTSILLWGLAQQPELHGRRWAMAVDIPGADEAHRATGMLSIRPTHYPDFPSFLVAYQRRLAEVRQGKDPMGLVRARTVNAAPWLRALLEQFAIGEAESLVGTIGLSVLSTAEVFLAPYQGFYKAGFLTFGSFALPSAQGPKGIVSARGPGGVAAARVETVRQALRWLETLEQNP